MWIKTNELTGKALAWAVAKCEGFYITIKPNEIVYVHPNGEWYSNGNWAPTDKWSQGGPIIEREKITLHNQESYGKTGVNSWSATITPKGSYDYHEYGETSLIAAMRCYVASKLGDEVEVPDELV